MPPLLRLETSEEKRRRREELRSYFPGSQFGLRSDVSKETYWAFVRALDHGSEERIQQFLAANPYLIQYVIPRSGHHGTWVFPKQMIKPGALNGTPGLIPDFLVATKSSLGFYWHIVELKRFDRQFANHRGDGLSSDGNRAIVQCQKYLDHFQNYIDAIRANIQAPALLQPEGVILLIGDSEKETSAQNAVRSRFDRDHSRIAIASYRRLLYGLARDVDLVGD